MNYYSMIKSQFNQQYNTKQILSSKTFYILDFYLILDLEYYIFSRMTALFINWSRDYGSRLVLSNVGLSDM